MRAIKVNEGCEILHPTGASEISSFFASCGFDSISGLELIDLINSASNIQLSPIDISLIKNQWNEKFDASVNEQVSISTVSEWLYSRSNYEIYS